MLIAGVLIPLASFVLLAFFGARLGKPRSGWLATGAIASSCILGAMALMQWHHPGEAGHEEAGLGQYVWAHIGAVPISIGVKLDSLTLIMFFMVSFVSTWIFVFSLGYMAGHSDEIDGESKFHRFFAYLSLFCFSMLGLVISNSLMLMFIFWELVGLCSYLLIGFYFHKRSASNAAIKAFVTNRVGDLGFILGIAMVFLYLGDLTLDGAVGAFEAEKASGISPLFTQTYLGLNLATWMGVLLFCGAVGKSAQFPLHVWLPDAMEGPTPVSALIHAATMVAAGVYLVARIYALLTPTALMVVAVIGCITLALAALVAIVQTDIKKVLAYSTISQLGYMILGMGMGAWIGALFHLLTHAFFKALMFLGSGQVIEGCHHEQDMRRMGGLWRKMPVTAVTFLVGVLAIAGVGIPMAGLGIGGYFSKDEILAVAHHRMSAGDVPGWLFWIPVAIAYVTPFYMMRCWWLTFMGRPRDEHVHEHAHESKLMYVPLVVLAVGTVVASYWLFRPMVAEAVPHAIRMETYDGGHHPEHGAPIDHETHEAVTVAVGGAFVVGFLLAWLIYRGGLDLASRIARALRPAHTLLVRKFYFDELYGLVFVGGVMVLRGLSYLFDRLVVDALVNASARATERMARFSGETLDDQGVDAAVNAVGESTWWLGDLVRRPQVGRVRNYILFAAGGAAIVVLLVAYPWVMRGN
jgi:NADH-quinone oxidoreductase subunit L